MLVEYEKVTEWAYTCGGQYYLRREGPSTYLRISKAEKCCTDMERFWEYTGITKFGELAFVHSEYGGDYGSDVYEEYPISFCPFCGSSIETRLVAELEIKPVYGKRRVKEAKMIMEELEKDVVINIDVTKKLVGENGG